ncbi:MAG: decaprenylphospho-beta-D-erythro-pentofuranosid-2-ulose 2-reductase [Acidimicrobiia bacterium]|nr:decaprenylphospho-beta-D-erythro-pentofuranosid-2-ulose 2-reductase [Acidimicrobiia bacterium]
MKDALGSPQSVLVLGGGSDIAIATVRLLAGSRAERVVLAARRPEALDGAVDDIRSAGARIVETVRFDATDFASHEAFVDDAWERFGDFDLVLFAFGVLGDQTRSENDPAAAVDVIQTNFTGAASVAIPVARRMLAQGHGSIVVLSSVAAERARRANFVYGSSKSGMDQFFQGLGDMLHGHGVHVMVVRPGFVRTKMTAGMQAAPFSTTPEEVARAIARGLERGKEKIWVPGPVRAIATAMHHIPRPIYRRLPL